MTSDPRDYRVSISGASAPGAAAGGKGAPLRPSGETRPFLGVHFKCCNVYTRVYRDMGGGVYRGACPKCGRTVRFRVGEGGSSARFFEAE